MRLFGGLTAGFQEVCTGVLSHGSNMFLIAAESWGCGSSTVHMQKQALFS